MMRRYVLTSFLNSDETQDCGFQITFSWEPDQDRRDLMVGDVISWAIHHRKPKVHIFAGAAVFGFVGGLVTTVYRNFLVGAIILAGVKIYKLDGEMDLFNRDRS
eukprot:g52249.t1